MDSAILKNRLGFIAGNCQKDDEGATVWGIFQPNPMLGNEKFWLVDNEVGGYTILLPSEN